MELTNAYIESWIQERMSHLEYNNMKELPGFDMENGNSLDLSVMAAEIDTLMYDYNYYDYNYYNYNYDYGYGGGTGETTTKITISTEILPYTPLVFTIYVEPNE